MKITKFMLMQFSDGFEDWQEYCKYLLYSTSGQMFKRCRGDFFFAFEDRCVESILKDLDSRSSRKGGIGRLDCQPCQVEQVELVAVHLLYLSELLVGLGKFLSWIYRNSKLIDYVYGE